MNQNTGFNFTENNTTGSNDTEFKRQRQQYLAQRNARKREAQKVVRKDFGGDSSSDDDPPPIKKQPVLINTNKKPEGSNTDSSQNSPDPDADFKRERQKYKNERLARKQEAIENKKIEFGSSSSEDQPLPVKPNIKITPEIKPQSAYNSEGHPQFGFVSLELSPKQTSSQRSPMLASVRLKEKNSDRKQAKQRERYEVQVPSKKGVNIWIQRWVQFKQNAIELDERVIPVYDITKAKMIIQPTQTGSNRIKITVKDEEVFLAANPKKMNQLNFIDQYYFIFARIITLKLQLMGRKPIPVSRIKAGLAEQVLKEARITGKLRKNSFFGGWQEKLAVVGNSGLAIYKEGKDKANLTVPVGSVREIWTRFELEKENLVVKFLNGSSKVELSIPVENFMNRDNWLYQLYTLTPK